MAPDAGERLDGGVSETGPEVVVHGRAVGGRPWRRCSDDLDVQLRVDLLGLDTGLPRDGVEEIGRASCREREAGDGVAEEVKRKVLYEFDDEHSEEQNYTTI